MTEKKGNETVAILYDIENAPFEMLNYTLGKARRFQPCRTIVVSDWDARPEQKRWEKLMRRPGFTFRQISRTFFGKNSLDSALYDSAQILYQEGVRKYFIITTDSDFVRIAESLNSESPSYIIGVGTKQASETLRNAYNEFFVYPPEEKVKKETTQKSSKQEKQTEQPVKQEDKEQKASKKKAKTKETKSVPQKQDKSKGAAENGNTAGKKGQAPKEEGSAAGVQEGSLTVRLPKTLRQSLEERRHEEGVSLDELVTYLLMRGLMK